MHIILPLPISFDDALGKSRGPIKSIFKERLAECAVAPDRNAKDEAQIRWRRMLLTLAAFLNKILQGRRRQFSDQDELE